MIHERFVTWNMHIIYVTDQERVFLYIFTNQVLIKIKIIWPIADKFLIIMITRYIVKCQIPSLK